VRLRVDGHCLLIEGEGEASAAWPLADVTTSPRLGSTPRVLRRAGHGQVECADSPLLEAWFPTRRTSRVEAVADWLERRRVAIAAAAGAIVLATVAFVQFGVPWMALKMSERMPAAVERHLSSEVVALMERLHFHATHVPPARRAALQRAFAELVRAEPRAGDMRVTFMDAPGIGANAFALPDGRIYVSDQLVELAGSDAELLAVLAHEAGHHVHRHAMRQAIENSSVFLAAGLMFGDMSGSSLAVSVPAVLLSNGFSRGHEREADAYAFDLLRRHGRSPAAFAAIMRRLADQRPHAMEQGVGGYLSTHPPTPERIAAAERAAAPPAEGAAADPGRP
jgi:Zn-dependent protease with chaperone function